MLQKAIAKALIHDIIHCLCAVAGAPNLQHPAPSTTTKVTDHEHSHHRKRYMQPFVTGQISRQADMANVSCA